MHISECLQLDIEEVEECSLGPKYADIDVKNILKNCDKRRQKHLLSLRGERRRRASGRKQMAMG